MTQPGQAEDKLKGMLRAVELPVKASYNPGEVCRILSIVPSTFWKLLSQYEKDDEGRLKRPDCLDSYMLSSHRRVRFDELVAFLVRNNSYDRRHAADPNQMPLF